MQFEDMLFEEKLLKLFMGINFAGHNEPVLEVLFFDVTGRFEKIINFVFPHGFETEVT